MKRILKRYTALLLVAITVLSYLLIEDGISAFASDVLFQDTFNSTMSDKWQNQSEGKVSGGQYVLDAGQSNYVNGISQEGNYIVAADVSMIFDTSAGKAGYVSVVANANTDMTEGYEFGIGATKTGTTFVRLYRLGSDGKAEILRQATTNIPGIEKVKKKNTYNLKLGVYGNRIICLIDDNIFADITDDTYKSGYMGIHADGIGAKYDNFEVHEMPEAKIEKLELISSSETLAATEKLRFEIHAVYNSIYGTETINQNTVGVSVSGYDGTVGEKMVKVSYKGKSIKFPVTVTASYTAETLWSDDFSKDLLSEEYSGGTYTDETYNFTYKFVVKDGKAQAKLPNLNEGNVAATTTLLLPSSTTKQWNSYSISTTATINSDSTSATKRYGQAGIAFMKSGGTNYTFRVCSDGNLYIQKGTTKLQTITLTDIGMSISKGQTVNLRVDKYGDFAEFYYNDKKVSTYWFDDAALGVSCGLTAINGDILFDDFKVTSLMERSKYAVTKISVVDTKGATVSHIQSKSLYEETLYVKAEYVDGFCYYVRITKDMIHDYDSSPNNTATQKVTVSYGTKKTSIKYTYTPYLFYDDFSGKAPNGKWTLYKMGNWTLDASIRKSRWYLTYPENYVDGETIYYLSYIADGEDWTDYAVSADVNIEDIYNSKDRVVAVTARQNMRTRYEFRMLYDSGTLKARLYKYVGSKGTIVGDYQHVLIHSAMTDGTRFKIGETYNIKMTVRGNCIQTYINGFLIDTYYDEDDNAMMSGTAGIYVANNSVLIDNFKVEQLGNSEIAALGIAGNSANTIELYEGHDINAWKEKLEVTYADGGKMQVQLIPDMISDYDNTALGKQKVTITYRGFSDNIYVNISERPDYLKDFEKQVKAFDKNITQANLESFYVLQDMYDSLSNYEIDQLSNAVKKKYEALYQSMEQLLYPEVKEKELLFDGNLDEEVVATFDQGREEYVGKWEPMNNMLYYVQRPYRIWGSGYSCTNIYGEINMVSADIMMLSGAMYAGVMLNWSQHGYYQARINSSGVDEQGNRTYVLQFSRHNGSTQSYRASCSPIDYGIEIKDGEWFNLTMTAVGGEINIYVNGILCLSYDDRLGLCLMEGEFAARISEGDALVKNLRAYGTEIELTTQEEEIEPTYYKDDFEDEATNANPSHWAENTKWDSIVDNWKVVSKGSNKVYGTSLQDNYSATYLHVFEKNPDYTARFMTDNIAEGGTFGFLTRQSPETAYVKIGYDGATSKWYICSQRALSEGEKIVYSKETFTLKKGTWYTAHVVEEGAKVSLYINDKLVIETEEAIEIAEGRLGFYAQGASMYVDDVNCTFSGGDIPQDGVIAYDVDPEESINYMEIEAVDKNTVVGISDGRVYYSENTGTSWKEVSGEDNWGELTGGLYTSVVQLHDGSWIQIRPQESEKGTMADDAFTVWKSTDFKQWNKLGRMITEDDISYSALGSSSPIIHISTACEIQLDDGTWRIFCPLGFRTYEGTSSGLYIWVFYSDDGGVTWQRAENDTTDVLPGAKDDLLSTWSESKLIKGSDGVLRLYCSRNTLGCMVYTESYDGGVTWKNLVQVPELQCAKSSFGICEDPTEPGTFYMVWVNSTDGFYRASLFPRYRACLVKSTDGKTWNFVTNLEWTSNINSPFNGRPLYQILDPSVQVTEDYVYVAFGCSTKEKTLHSSGGHQDQKIHYTRLEKDKLTTRAWDATTLCDVDYPVKVEYEVAPQTKYGLGDLFVVGQKETLKLTGLSGKVYNKKFQGNCTIHSEPNMFKLGKQTVEVSFYNGYDMSYEIEIVPNYKLTWNISEGGKVVNQMKKLMEGATQEFELNPDTGYQVQYVKVNGEKISVKKNKFTIENIKEDLEIEVVFSQKTLLDYWLVILSSVLLLGIGGYVGLSYMKKKKGKNAKADVVDMPPTNGGI